MAIQSPLTEKYFVEEIRIKLHAKLDNKKHKFSKSEGLNSAKKKSTDWNNVLT